MGSPEAIKSLFLGRDHQHVVPSWPSFDELDKNKDGVLDREEYVIAQERYRDLQQRLAKAEAAGRGKGSRNGEK